MNSRLWMATLGQFAPPLLLLPTFISIRLVQRMWAREESRRLSRLESFSISTATCSSEDDRAPVEHNIVLLLKDLGHVAVDADRADALNMFDEAVRWNLPHAIKDRVCIPSDLFSEAFVGGGGRCTFTFCLHFGAQVSIFIHRLTALPREGDTRKTHSQSKVMSVFA